MANDLNSLSIIGRLTRDAEYKVSQMGGGVSRFAIAVNRRKKTADGLWEDEANFFNCVLMGKQAESLSQYLEKGRQVAIQGELRQNRWTDQQGQARSSVEIFVESVQFLYAPNGANGEETARANAQTTSRAPRSNAYEATHPGQSATKRAAQPQTQSGQYRYTQQPNPDGMSGPETYSDDDVPF